MAMTNPWLAIDVATAPIVRARELRRAWERFVVDPHPEGGCARTRPRGADRRRSAPRRDAAPLPGRWAPWPHRWPARDWSSPSQLYWSDLVIRWASFAR